MSQNEMESWVSEAGSDSGHPGTLTGNTDSPIPQEGRPGCALPVQLSPRSPTGVPHDLEAPPGGAGGCGTGTRQTGAGRGQALAGRAELKLLPPECVFPSDSNPFIRLRSLACLPSWAAGLRGRLGPSAGGPLLRCRPRPPPACGLRRRRLSHSGSWGPAAQRRRDLHYENEGPRFSEGQRGRVRNQSLPPGVHSGPPHLSLFGAAPEARPLLALRAAQRVRKHTGPAKVR